MTRDVIVIDPERTVLEAAKRMAAKKIGGLVVVAYGRPVGLVTDRDILWKVTSTGRNPGKVLVRDIMTSPVATVSPLTTLRAAARVMLEEDALARRHAPGQSGGDHHGERSHPGFPRGVRPRDQATDRAEVRRLTWAKAPGRGTFGRSRQSGWRGRSAIDRRHGPPRSTGSRSNSRPCRS